MMRRVLLVLFVLTLSGSAAAHSRSVSYSTWSVDGSTVTVTVRLGPLEQSALDAAIAHAGLEPSERTRASALMGSLTAAHCQPLPTSYVGGRWQLRCAEAPSALEIHSDLLFDALPGHVHFLRSGSVQRVLTATQRSTKVPLTAPATTFGAARETLGLGVRHILSGWDHLVFLLALLLAARSFRKLALVVSGFTLGHSVTLSLAALGVVHVRSDVVEAAIGLSIVVVAIENVWQRRWHLPALVVVASVVAAVLTGSVAYAGLGLFAACTFGLLARSERPERLRSGLAALFGLVHGLGFASVLGELELPRRTLVGSLFGFNVGVELGQLAVIALAWTVLVLLGERRRRRIAVLELGSAVAAMLGSYWFVVRGFS